MATLNVLLRGLRGAILTKTLKGDKTMLKKLLVALFAVFAFSGLASAAVDINTATVEQLDGIKGVGPTKAKAIVEYRTKNGPFKSVDDLEKVKGFGKKSVDALRTEISVGEAPKVDAKKK